MLITSDYFSFSSTCSFQKTHKLPWTISSLTQPTYFVKCISCQGILNKKGFAHANPYHNLSAGQISPPKAISSFTISPIRRIDLTEKGHPLGCPFSLFRQRPTFPGSFPPSIIGTTELNFRVRDGNGCDLCVITTEYFVYIFVHTQN